MFERVRPEQVGICSGDVIDYIKMLEDRGLAMHSVLLARGNKLFAECYFAPYDKDSLHRMYSTTKSYVGIAVAQLIADKKLSADDKIVDFFPEYQKEKIHPWLAEQTIENMLTMQTAMDVHGWFKDKPSDRVAHYFSEEPSMPAGTSFHYDSEGSFVLGALVERITGKKLLDYLREKCLDEIGFSKDAYCLTAPGGHSWGDSALLCTALDHMRFGRLLAQKGEWNGKQLLDRDAVERACSSLVDNYCDEGITVNSYDQSGYGYQIWQIRGRAFGFCGMHCQFMIHDPKTDITFVCTAGNPKGAANQILIEGLFNYIIQRADKVGCSVSEDEYDEFIRSRKLHALEGKTFSEFESELATKKFIARENPMGIKDFSFRFEKEHIVWCYTNEQGYKELAFGRGKNNFCDFPHTGYSKEVGSVPCPGHTYKCAASAIWKNDKRMTFKVQVIDEYIGVMVMNVSFKDGLVYITMCKHCENFMDEYNGVLVADMM